jgi:hypothetical protein
MLLAIALFAAPVKEEAAASGMEWVKLIDSGKYAYSWREASAFFRARIPEKQWVTMIQVSRAPLGALVSRKKRSVTFTSTLSGAPDCNYAVIVFDSSFENKASAMEQITVIADGDKWRVAGYFIR